MHPTKSKIAHLDGTHRPRSFLGPDVRSRKLPHRDETQKRPLAEWRMPKSKCKRMPKAVLRLPDLEQSKSAALNSLASQSSHRSYDHVIREFIEWYCTEPPLGVQQNHCDPLPHVS
jgi:hypothetical protein